MGRYNVVRIDQNQKRQFASLFNQYEVFPGEKLFGGDPVIFMVMTNCTRSVPVGFIQLYPVQSLLQSTPTTIVSDLFVLPDHRNNGIALKLIEAAVKFAIHIRSAVIQLETSPDNLVAQKLCESVGFKRRPSKSESEVYSIQFETEED
jgi:ribosomal protein S18 acetylase RimI-like enzyme